MKKPDYKEVIEYMDMKGITAFEAYHAFSRMGRPPLVRTMAAVYRRVCKTRWGE